MEAIPRSALEVVQATVAALEAERWADVLPLVRPEALQTLRDTHMAWMLESERRTPRTVEEIQAAQPWLAREVAAYYAEEEQKHVPGGVAAQQAEWGVSSFRELEALTPAEFFIRYLSASTPAAKVRAALAVSHKPPKDLPRALQEVEAVYRRRWVVLGEVGEGADMAHVVYRELLTADGANSRVTLTTLDYVDSRWWLRIDHTLLDPHGWCYAWAPEDDEETGT